MLINEVFGWFWIAFGFLSGTFMGMGFQNEEWMGGYGSHPRRLLRLGHISFLGLGMLNILFAHSLVRIQLDLHLLRFASYSFILGAITMPICCSLMARDKRWQPFFAIPVISLNIGVVLVLMGLIHL